MNLGGRGMGARSLTEERSNDSPTGVGIVPEKINRSMSTPRLVTLFPFKTPAVAPLPPWRKVTSRITSEGTLKENAQRRHSPLHSRYWSGARGSHLQRRKRRFGHRSRLSRRNPGGGDYHDRPGRNQSIGKISGRVRGQAGVGRGHGAG